MDGSASSTEVTYLSGFANHFATEARAGALPVGQNSPQKVNHGLYAEQLSGTAFTAPRAHNLRSWLYRLRPSASHSAYKAIDAGSIRSAPFHEPLPFNRLRWDPIELPAVSTDFIAGLHTIAATGDVATQNGCAAHVYAANASMKRVFFNADGELLLVPELGALQVFTEMGRLHVAPGELIVIPRGVRFRIDVDGPSRGYVCENYGTPFRLPDLGPIGANGLANPRDFLTPTAAFEDVMTPTELVAKFGGGLHQTMLDHSPLDVVAWHGNLAPYKYDMKLFNAFNSVTYDHPDPSIFTVLTSPSEVPGTASVDFVIFPPRWVVAEHTFRPPWYHRNVMSEFMGLIQGVYDAKAEGFVPGGVSLHNCMTSHGPDRATFDKASSVELVPHRVIDTLAFMFETRYPFRITSSAMQSKTLQPDYDACWDGLGKLS